LFEFLEFLSPVGRDRQEKFTGREREMRERGKKNMGLKNNKK
jgi:hypothetical protein